MRVELIGLPFLVWQVQYLTAQPGSNETFKPSPEPAGSGKVQDLKKIPPWLKAFSLELRVQNEIRLNGQSVTVLSDPFHVTCYQVHRTPEEARTAERAGRRLVAVHPCYEGRVWVSTARA